MNYYDEQWSDRKMLKKKRGRIAPVPKLNRSQSLALARKAQAVPEGLKGRLVYLHLTQEQWEAIDEVDARDRTQWITENCNKFGEK